MQPLNHNELEIMKILWDHGSQKPAEIQDKLSNRVKNSALRWQLGELVQKGYVARAKKGKAYFYRAKTPRQSALRNLSERLAEVFSGGSAVAFLGQLIKSQDLSEDDLAELQRIASAHVGDNESEKGKK